MDFKRWGIWLITLCVLCSSLTVFQTVEGTTIKIDKKTPEHEMKENNNKGITDSNLNLTETLLPKSVEEGIEPTLGEQEDKKDVQTNKIVGSKETKTKQIPTTDKEINVKIDAEIINEFTKIDTTKAFGEEHTFYQKINIEQITAINHATLVILVKPPYSGWFDPSKVSIGDVADSVSSTFSELEDGTIEIKYQFNQLTNSINFEVPIKLTSGTKVGANPENPAYVTSYFETTSGEKFGESSQTAELLGAINKFKALNLNMTQNSEIGKLETSSNITSWKYSVPDKDLIDGLIDELLFYPSDIRGNGNPKIYLGQLEFEYTLPMGIEPIIIDENLVKYDKDLRLLRVYSDDNVGFEKDSTIILPEVVQFLLSGLPATGTVALTLNINAINKLDQGYKTLLETNRLTIDLITLDSEESETVNIYNTTLLDTVYGRKSPNVYMEASVTYRNKTNDKLYWVASIDHKKSPLVSSSKGLYIDRLSLAMGESFEGTIAVYLSRDGIEKTELIEDNITAATTNNMYVEKTDNKYLIVEGDKDFKQQIGYEKKINSLRIHYKLEDTSKIYSKENPTADFHTYSSFNNGIETISTTPIIKKARNSSTLTVTNNITELTNNEEFKDVVSLFFSETEYYEGAGTLVALIPEGVNVEHVDLGKTALGYQTVQNYKDSGKAAVVIRLETVSELLTASSPTLKVTFTYTATDTLVEGEFDTKYMYVKPEGYKNEIHNIYSPVGMDVYDMDDNGDETEAISEVEKTFNYHRTKQLITILKASGTESKSFSDTQNETLSYANEPDFDYQVDLVNNFDNTDIKSVTLITKIPKKDMKDFEGSATTNQLSMNLTTIDAPDGFDIYYLTEDASDLTSTNEVNYSWTATRPTISSVSAIKYVSNADFIIKAGEVTKVGYSVSAALQTTAADIGKEMNATIIISTAGVNSNAYIESDVKRTLLTAQKQTLKIKNQSINGKDLAGGVYNIYDTASGALLSNVDLEKESSIEVPNIEVEKLRIVAISHPNEQYTVKNKTQEITMGGYDPKVHEIVFEYIPEVMDFEVNSSQLYISDIWDPADNIILVDKEGVQHVPHKESDFANDYTVIGTVDTNKIGIYNIEYSVNDQKKTTTVQVISGIVVDATDETNELVEKETEDNKNQNGGLIKLNYVSDFNFGEQTYDIKNTVDFSAIAQKDTNWQDKDRNPFINIENRQELTEDYTVSAAITKSFEMDNEGKQHELKGYQLNFNTGAANYGETEVLEGKFTLDAEGVAVPIISSHQKGSKSLEFSTVELTTPAGVYQYNGEYTGEVTWSIQTGP